MSQEYNKILRCGPQLSKAFQSHLPALPSAMLKKHLITSNNVAEVNNIHVGLPDRAAKLLGFIRNKVSLNKDCYYEFVDALKEDEDDQFNDVLQILGEAPKPAANRQQNGKETNGSSHAPPKAATVVFHDIHGEERPRFSEADMKEILQSKEPQNEPSTYRAEIESYVSKVLVLIHTVKEEELVAVYKYLKPPIDGFKHTIKYYATREMSLILGKFGNHDAAVVQTEKSGDCADDIRKALRKLPNVKLIIGVGFAYGKKDKCKFGDVLVSKIIYDVKSTRLEKEGVRPEGGHAMIDMDRVVNIFVRGTLTHRFESVTADPVTRKPKVFADTIMSGPNLVNNPQNVGDILKHDARSVGGEMEGNVVAKCVRSFCKENEGREIDYVIIKGVADYGDGTKGKPWQFTASLAAADYADHRLEKEGGKVYYLTEEVPTKKLKIDDFRSTKLQVNLSKELLDTDELLTQSEQYQCGVDVEKDNRYVMPPDKETSECTGVMDYTYDELKESIKQENLIGEGGFGKVYKGSARSTSIAVKVLFECGVSSMKEINCLSRYRQENILPLMGYCKHQIENPNGSEQGQQQLILVLPYMEKGSLHKMLHTDNVPIPWDTRVTILTDTARGLSYLHHSDPPLVHQDIKSSNILISEHGRAKVCDFGFSINLPEGKSNNTLVTAAKNLQMAVSFGYSPPELVEGNYSCYGDVYSYGIVVLETYTRKLPYSKERDCRRIADLFEDQRSDKIEFAKIADESDGKVPPKTIETFFTIVKGCVKNCDKKRLSISEVMALWERFANNAE